MDFLTLALLKTGSQGALLRWVDFSVATLQFSPGVIKHVISNMTCEGFVDLMFQFIYVIDSKCVYSQSPTKKTSGVMSGDMVWPGLVESTIQQANGL